MLPLLAFLGLSCASPTPKDINKEPALVGYYAGDGSHLAEHRIGQLTHLIWCFGHLQNDSMVIAEGQLPVLREMVGFKKAYPKLKVLLSLGGWGGCSPCSESFGRSQGRLRFAGSVRRLLESYGADGIDLDWEYPVVKGFPGHRYAPEDKHNFTLLVRELRKELGNDYEITFAAGGTDECLLEGFEWDSIVPVVDRVHLMSYDLVHGYSTTTGHHTPLFSGENQLVSAHRAVQLLEGQGVPRNKLVIGSAFYGRVFNTQKGGPSVLYAPAVFAHTIPYSAFDTTITAAKGWTWYHDDKALAPYACNPLGNSFFTCDDSASVAAKAQYVLDERLGGIMFWQLADDRPEHGLLETMHHTLRRQ